jgi:hypothetical protein
MLTIYKPERPCNDNDMIRVVADGEKRKAFGDALFALIRHYEREGCGAGDVIEELADAIHESALRSCMDDPWDYETASLDRYLQLSRIAGALRHRSSGLFSLPVMQEWEL